MEEHKIASLKLSKDLKFYDLKLENDYSPYLSGIIEKIFLFFILAEILFIGYLLIFQGILNVLTDSKISLILYSIWIILSFFFCFHEFKEKLKKYFVIYFYIGILLNIISIYIEPEYNDLKIGVFILINISFAVLFCLREFIFIVIGSIIYFIAILPALFLSNMYFVNINLFKSSDLTKNEKIEDYPLDISYMTQNISLYVISCILIFSSLVILFIYGYNQELYSRINFLKLDHKRIQFKKDQEIFDNLVPKFIQNKMESTNRGASIEEEIVTVIFVKICDFDGLVTKMSPKEFINLLDRIYSTFDQLCAIHGLQKIETVGDTYMASGGIKECEKDLDPVILSKPHSIRTFELALDMIDLMSKMRLENGDTIKIKVGVHTREVNAAVVGNHKPQFSLIGDTVNTTARMSAYSKENSILITEEAYNEISKSYQDFVMLEKEVKGKGKMKTFLCAPIKSKAEKEQDKQAKNVYANFLKNGLNKRGREGNLIGDLELDENKLERKNSIKSNNSGFIIDQFGTEKEKIKPEVNFSIIDPTNKHKKPESLIYKNSCFFIYYYDNNLINISMEKNEKPSYLFSKYSEHKYKSTSIVPIYINYIFAFCIFSICYYYSYYNSKYSYNEKIIGLKLLNCLILTYTTNQIKLLNEIKSKSQEISIFLIYFSFIILLQIQFNLYPKEFLIFLTVEQNLTIIASFFNGVLTYLQMFTLLILYIIAFGICIAIGHNNILIIRYSCISILLSILFYGYYVFREYIGTIEYLENKQQAEELKAREKLLFNLMPPHVVQYLKEDIPVVDELFDVTMLYTDIVQFTAFSQAQSSPKNVVRMLIELFKRFDDAVIRNDVYKVHTIGDCYVVLGFTGKVPSNERDPADEAMKVINIGKELITIIKEVAATKEVNFPALNMRIGIHTVSKFFNFREQLLLE